MEFRIADTFTASLGKLTNAEQTAVKTTAFDLQANPASPGLSFHKLDKAKDKNFWSVRVNADIRMIVHRTGRSLLICYVDHHDKAYSWAEKRRLEVHPQTGAAQIVEVRETVQEIVVRRYVEKEVAVAPRPLFATYSDDLLLSYGVPEGWMRDVRDVVTVDQLLGLVDHLPREASDALLTIADGGVPEITKPAETLPDPFDHPDAQRRFRVIENVEELELALSYPWEKWAIFLHPVQRQFAEREFNGPARVAGTAGTGKTIVALHRAVILARRNPDARVLLTTFSETLANALKTKLRLLLTAEPRLAERIDVHSLPAIGRRLYDLQIGKSRIATRDEIAKVVEAAAETVAENAFSTRFLIAEWEQIVDLWQIRSWEEYRTVHRLGRKTRLAESQRSILWSVFEKVIAVLESRGLMTDASVFAALTCRLSERGISAYDFAVVDEAQDISPSQLKFLAAMAGGRQNGLFFAGDLGQRIFQQAFSWLSVGVDVRGRSRSLKINYRTSHQIRSHADRLLEPEIADVDGNIEDRRATISVFNGPSPEVKVFDSQEDEIAGVAQWLRARLAEGVKPHEIGVFVRSEAQLPRAQATMQAADIKFRLLDANVETVSDHASVGTMHLAKGLEFRAVAVMACDDEVIPLQSRIEQIGDEADLKEVYETERHLLYVACTRARDYLLVSAAGYESEFLGDI